MRRPSLAYNPTSCCSYFSFSFFSFLNFSFQLFLTVRLAVITHAFPPSRHANGKRPYYLAKAFMEAGWEVDVFTSNLGCDSEFEEMLSVEQLRVFRVSDPVVNLLEKLKSISFLYRIGVSAASMFMWPDFYSLWSRRVMKRMKREAEYDRVLAFIFPSSVYLNAKMGFVNDSWTFDLQESVTPQYKVVPRRSPLQKFKLPQLVELEKKALHQAGHVVYTANTNRQSYIKHGLVFAENAEHIPYFYDARVFEQEAPEIAPNFQIVYFGTFDWQGSRSPKVFFNALALFLKNNPNARSKTKFVFYGMWLAEHDVLIDELGLGDVVDIRDAVPYNEYLEKVRSAPVLLLVISVEHNLFMPSKIVDYFGASRPILAFVPNGSEMRQVLEEAGMAEQAVDEADIEGGVKALELLWLRYQSGALGDLASNTEFWSSDVQIPRYVEMLNLGGQ